MHVLLSSSSLLKFWNETKCTVCQLGIIKTGPNENYLIIRLFNYTRITPHTPYFHCFLCIILKCSKLSPSLQTLSFSSFDLILIRVQSSSIPGAKVSEQAAYWKQGKHFLSSNRKFGIKGWNQKTNWILFLPSEQPSALTHAFS